MASAHLKERLNHLMSYEGLRNRALSHRLVVAFAAMAILAVTVGSGMRAATTQQTDDSNKPYKLSFVVRLSEQPNMLVFFGRIVDVKTGRAVSQPTVTFPRGQSASLRAEVGGKEFEVEMRDLGPNVQATLRVAENGSELQESTYMAVPQNDQPSYSPYTGAPISLDLKDADIKNVLDTFSKLTRTTIEYPPDLEGKVTINVKNTPWDEAIDIILREQGLRFELHGDKIVIMKK